MGWLVMIWLMVVFLLIMLWSSSKQQRKQNLVDIYAKIKDVLILKHLEYETLQVLVVYSFITYTHLCFIIIIWFTDVCGML
jgi:hypothetical protein